MAADGRHVLEFSAWPGLVSGLVRTHVGCAVCGACLSGLVPDGAGSEEVVEELRLLVRMFGAAWPPDCPGTRRLLEVAEVMSL